MIVSTRLDESAIADFLATQPKWSRDGDFLVRRFEAASARHALQLIQRIGDLAEGANHHPDLYWVYNRLTIKLSTHDAGGITSKDTHLAKCIEDVLLSP